MGRKLDDSLHLVNNLIPQTEWEIDLDTSSVDIKVKSRKGKYKHENKTFWQ